MIDSQLLGKWHVGDANC